MDVLWLVLKILVAVVAAGLIYLSGAAVVRMFRVVPPPPNEPPQPSELTKVSYEYRCIVCGMTVVMTAAPTDDPEDGPRHCREDMRLVVEESAT